MKKSIEELGAIIGVTLLSHLVGSVIFAGITGGVFMILAAPLVAFFGWFMLIPEFAIVLMQWEILKRQKLPIVKAWIFTVLGSCVAFTLITPKEQGSIWLCATAYAIGSLVAFSLSFEIIRRLLSQRTNLTPHRIAG